MAQAKHTSPLPLRGVFLLIPALLAGGCTSVSLSDRVALSSPEMGFAESPAYADTPSILASVEPGTDDRGGAAAQACTVCR